MSQDFIVPISSSQDSAGPMATTVAGAALMLAAMDEVDVDYMPYLTADALDAKRIGVARFAQGEHKGIAAVFEASLKRLEAAGAALVELDEFESPDGFWDQSFLVLLHEFKATLNAYLADTAPGNTVRDLDGLIAFNNASPQELALFDQDLLEQTAKAGGLDEPAYLAALSAVGEATRGQGIDKLLSDHQLDAIVSPSAPLAPPVDAINGDVWPDWAGAGYLAAIAGYPHLTVPMGAVRGAPVGLSFIGGKNADAQILAYGFAFEQQGPSLRPTPQFLRTAGDLPEIGAALRAPASK